jgi:hypothetical protein
MDLRILDGEAEVEVEERTEKNKTKDMLEPKCVHHLE